MVTDAGLGQAHRLRGRRGAARPARRGPHRRPPTAALTSTSPTCSTSAPCSTPPHRHVARLPRLGAAGRPPRPRPGLPAPPGARRGPEAARHALRRDPQRATPVGRARPPRVRREVVGGTRGAYLGDQACRPARLPGPRRPRRARRRRRPPTDGSLASRDRVAGRTRQRPGGHPGRCDRLGPRRHRRLLDGPADPEATQAAPSRPAATPAATAGRRPGLPAPPTPTAPPGSRRGPDRARTQAVRPAGRGTRRAPAGHGRGRGARRTGDPTARTTPARCAGPGQPGGTPRLAAGCASACWRWPSLLVLVARAHRGRSTSAARDLVPGDERPATTPPDAPPSPTRRSHVPVASGQRLRPRRRRRHRRGEPRAVPLATDGDPGTAWEHRDVLRRPGAGAVQVGGRAAARPRRRDRGHRRRRGRCRAGLRRRSCSRRREGAAPHRPHGRPRPGRATQTGRRRAGGAGRATTRSPPATSCSG